MEREELFRILINHGKWTRGETGGIRANLSGADLRSANLSGADLNSANLSGADLIGADLIGANLSGANLSGADLIGADLIGANLSGADLIGANLSGANLSGANLSGAILSGAYLRSANLRSANLSGADLSGATGIDQQLPTHFFRLIPPCPFIGPIEDPDDVGVIFRRHQHWLNGESGSTQARFNRRDFRDVDFSGKNLRSVVFDQCSVVGCNFRGCDLTDVQFTGSVDRCDFSNVRGLRLCYFGRQPTNSIYVGCSDCTSCHDCHARFPTTQRRSLTTRDEQHSVCNACAHRQGNVQCPNCDVYAIADAITTMDDGTRYCRRCVDQYFHVCDMCEELRRESHSILDVDGDNLGRWCTQCADDNAYVWSSDGNYHDTVEPERLRPAIREYHACHSPGGFNPLPGDWGSNTSASSDGFVRPLYFGTELEVETSRQSLDPLARAVKASLGDFAASIEHDGSLDHGFEIISQPSGLQTHRAAWINADLRGLKSHTTTTCGLHVHFTRAAVSSLTLARMVHFIYREDNKHFVETVCRRTFNGYARQARKDKISHGAGTHDGRTPFDHRATTSLPRYEAINLTNKKTIEFRLPRGTCRKSTIIATVEFVYALIRFCEVTSTQLMDHGSFERFITTDPMLSDTRYLRAYLVQQRLMTEVDARLPKMRPEAKIDALMASVAPALTRRLNPTTTTDESGEE